MAVTILPSGVAEWTDNKHSFEHKLGGGGQRMLFRFFILERGPDVLRIGSKQYIGSGEYPRKRSMDLVEFQPKRFLLLQGRYV